MGERFTDYPNKLCKANESDNVNKIRRGKKTSTRTGLDKMLCIHYDNSPEHGRYFENLDDDDITDIESRIEDAVNYSDLLHVEALDRTDEEYSAGDSIPTKVDTWVQYDYTWPMPSADIYGNCNDMNNARWMQSAEFPMCTRPQTPG